MIQLEPCPGEAGWRCCCGQLLAVLTDRGVEIKCKRCKQVTVIPIEKRT